MSKKFSVNNYVDGKEIFVVFSSGEEMTRYIQEEASYCANARSNYLAALSREEIDRTKSLFHAKRIEFAKSRGYSPMSKNSDTWIKHGTQFPVENGVA